MHKIIQIESARHMDGSSWEVGKDVLVNSEWKEVTEIKDASVEFDNGIYVRYDIYAQGKLLQSLENMPVIITYETED